LAWERVRAQLVTSSPEVCAQLGRSEGATGELFRALAERSDDEIRDWLELGVRARELSRDAPPVDLDVLDDAIKQHRDALAAIDVELGAPIESAAHDDRAVCQSLRAEITLLERLPPAQAATFLRARIALTSP